MYMDSGTSPSYAAGTPRISRAFGRSARAGWPKPTMHAGSSAQSKKTQRGIGIPSGPKVIASSRCSSVRKVSLRSASGSTCSTIGTPNGFRSSAARWKRGVTTNGVSCSKMPSLQVWNARRGIRSPSRR